MAGFLSGFQTGWGLADRELEQQEEQRRYDAGVALEQERYDAEQSRLAKQDARAQEQHDMEVEQNQYQIGRRGVQEQADQLALQQSEQAVRANEIAFKQEEINNWGTRLAEEYRTTGKYNPDTVIKFAGASSGTAWDLGDITDDNYIRSIDTVDKIIRENPSAINSEEGLQALNTLYAKQINKGEMVEGGVSKQISRVTTDNQGNLQFMVDTLDQSGQPIKSSPLSDGRGVDGQPMSIPIEKVVDHLTAKKMAVATFMANPDGMNQIKSVVNAVTGGGDAQKIAQTPQQKFAVEQLSGLMEEYNSAMNPAVGLAGNAVKPDQDRINALRTQITQAIAANPYLAEFAPQFAPASEQQRQQLQSMLQSMRPKRDSGVNAVSDEMNTTAVMAKLNDPNATLAEIQDVISRNFEAAPQGSSQTTQQNDSILQSIINSPNQSPAEKAGQIYQSLGIMNNQANAMSARAQQ